VGSGISDRVFKYRHRDLCQHLGIEPFQVVRDFADAARDSNHLPSTMIPKFELVGNPPGPAASIRKKASTILAPGTDVDTERGGVTEDRVAGARGDEKGKGVDSAATRNPSRPKARAKESVDAGVAAEQDLLMQPNKAVLARLDLSGKSYVHKSPVDLETVPALRGQVC
jgi:hypothetical protein